MTSPFSRTSPFGTVQPLRAGSIDNAVSCAHDACGRDLPVTKTEFDGHVTLRRPSPADVDVYSFSQPWKPTVPLIEEGDAPGPRPDTAQMTVVVHRGAAAVYCGLRLIYVIKSLNDAFRADLSRHLLQTDPIAALVYERQPMDLGIGAGSELKSDTDPEPEPQGPRP